MNNKQAIQLLNEMYDNCLMITATDPKRFLKAEAIEMAIKALQEPNEEPSGVTAEAAEIALLTQVVKKNDIMSKIAHEKLDKIRFIVNFEVGNRHEIGDKILAVIDGGDDE